MFKMLISLIRVLGSAPDASFLLMQPRGANGYGPITTMGFCHPQGRCELGSKLLASALDVTGI